MLPETPLPNHIAVIAGGMRSILIVPLVNAAYLLTVVAFGADTQINQEPRQMPSNPSAEAVGL